MKCDGSNDYPGPKSDEYPEHGPFTDFLRALDAHTGQPFILVSLRPQLKNGNAVQKEL